MVTWKTKFYEAFRAQHLYLMPISEQPGATLPQTFIRRAMNLHSISCINAQFNVHFEEAPSAKYSLVTTWVRGLVYTCNRHLFKDLWIKSRYCLTKSS